MNELPHQQIREELEKIGVAREHLHRLAKSFFAVGNEQVGYRLQQIANALVDAQDGIDNAVGEWIMQDFGNAREASTNMLNAMLAVTKDD